MEKHIIDLLSNKGEDFKVNKKLLNYNDANLYYINAVNNLDLNSLVGQGILSKKDPTLDLYSLIRESNSKPLFRMSNGSEILNHIWAAKALRNAKEIFVGNTEIRFNPSNLSLEMIKGIVNKSVTPNELTEIKNILFDIGIILVYEKYIPNSKVDGMVAKLPNGVPVIGLSLRFSRLDSFWFTLMHEIAHIKLHYEVLENPIIDDMENLPLKGIENEANSFAKFSIVDKAIWRTCDARVNTNEKSVLSFAKENKVHPALIAGLIRYEQNNYSLFSNIINSVDVREILLKK